MVAVGAPRCSQKGPGGWGHAVLSDWGSSGFALGLWTCFSTLGPVLGPVSAPAQREWSCSWGCGCCQPGVLHVRPPGARWGLPLISGCGHVVVSALTVISFCLSASLVTVPSVESVTKVEMGRDCFPRVTAQEHWAPCTRAAWKNGYPPPTQVTVSSATQNLL